MLRHTLSLPAGGLVALLVAVFTALSHAVWQLHENLARYLRGKTSVQTVHGYPL